MTTITTLTNVWKWNLEHASIAWNEKRYDDHNRHVKNALNIEDTINTYNA